MIRCSAIMLIGGSDKATTQIGNSGRGTQSDQSAGWPGCGCPGYGLVRLRGWAYGLARLWIDLRWYGRGQGIDIAENLSMPIKHLPGSVIRMPGLIIGLIGQVICSIRLVIYLIGSGNGCAVPNVLYRMFRNKCTI